MCPRSDLLTWTPNDSSLKHFAGHRLFFEAAHATRFQRNERAKTMHRMSKSSQARREGGATLLVVAFLDNPHVWTAVSWKPTRNCKFHELISDFTPQVWRQCYTKWTSGLERHKMDTSFWSPVSSARIWYPSPPVTRPSDRLTRRSLSQALREWSPGKSRSVSPGVLWARQALCLAEL